MPELSAQEAAALILNLRDTVTPKQKEQALMLRKMEAARKIENMKIEKEESL
tara:strand:+ start:486 stop:641 length:156 start_codon:yes stop_codon:yes gene_type:complete